MSELAVRAALADLREVQLPKKRHDLARLEDRRL
jgi:hypothetical protein